MDLGELSSSSEDVLHTFAAAADRMDTDHLHAAVNAVQGNLHAEGPPHESLTLPTVTAFGPDPQPQLMPTFVATAASATAVGDKSVRVGDDYQAIIPMAEFAANADLNKYTEGLPKHVADPRLVWSPSHCTLSQQEVDLYVARCQQASPAISIDQALGILHWHNYNAEAALADVKEYEPHPDLYAHWLPPEVAAFEQAFVLHGKRFHKISAMIPGKSTRNVIRFYYKWKKTRKIDRKMENLLFTCLRREAAEEAPQLDDEEDSEAAARRNRRNAGRADSQLVCANCGDVEEQVHVWQSRDFFVCHLCDSCAAYFRKWGRDKALSRFDLPPPNRARRRHEPRRDPTIVDIVSASKQDVVDRSLHAFLAAESQVARLDSELLSRRFEEEDGINPKPYNRDARAPPPVKVAPKGPPVKAKGPKSHNNNNNAQQFQNMTFEQYQQQLELSGAAGAGAAGDLNGRKFLRGKRESIWPAHELVLAKLGLIQFGRDFNRIATDLLNNSKTGAQVKNWFNNYRKKLNLEFFFNIRQNMINKGINPKTATHIGDGIEVDTQQMFRSGGGGGGGGGSGSSSAGNGAGAGAGASSAAGGADAGAAGSAAGGEEEEGGSEDEVEEDVVVRDNGNGADNQQQGADDVEDVDEMEEDEEDGNGDASMQVDRAQTTTAAAAVGGGQGDDDMI
eukprot:m.74455 g.74455  ORF g.74455 m.74455 type:complete len:677 (+) comp14504_c0_seq1:150-2180(+)